MIALGLAGVMLCSAFYRATLVPRLVAVWGLFGYAILLGGSLLQVLGFDLQLIHTIPGGLWELFIGVWLIVKGFIRNPDDRFVMSTTPFPEVPPLPSEWERVSGGEGKRGDVKPSTGFRINASAIASDSDTTDPEELPDPRAHAGHHPDRLMPTGAAV